MKVVTTIQKLKENILRSALSPVGLVPTMGALHEGHASLVTRAVTECPIVVVSIFVNPTQFNDKNDLKNYPRTMDDDLMLLGQTLRKEDLVFCPDVSEMYPDEDKRQFSFGNLDNVMEALHRPGHFNGVAQIVSKLFAAAEPDIAYFGIKDFQQLAVIKAMTRQLRLPVRIVSCPIVREKDGLAMSSRNRLLEPGIRKNAPIIFGTISRAAELIHSLDIPEIKQFVLESVNTTPGFEVEYFEIADDIELLPVNHKNDMISGRKYYGCIAVKAGKIRLIDNVELPAVHLNATR